MAQVKRYTDTDVVGGAGDGTSWEDAYASMNAWNAAEATNLVTAGNYHTVYCRASQGTADTTTVNITGWMTGAANYIEIIGFDFPSDGVFNATKYVLHNNNTATQALKISVNYIRIINIQFLATGSGAATRHAINIGGFIGASDIRIDSCIVKGICSGTGLAAGIIIGDVDATVTIYNTVIYDFVSGGDANFKGIQSDDCSATYIYNCTIYNCYYGIWMYDGNVTAINCAVGNNADDFAKILGTLNIDHCCSDDGNGTNPQNPLGGNWANEFKNPGTDFSLLQSGNCVGNGVDNPGSGLYSDDIRGLERSSNWDIGAFEYGSLFKMDIFAVASLAMNLVSVSFAPLIGRWTWPVKERLRFNTEILASHDRTEQRITKRKSIPERHYSTKLFLEGLKEKTRFEAIIHNWLRKKWQIPIWPEAEIHNGLLPAGSSSIVIDTRYADFRANGYAVIWQDKENFEIVIVSTVNENELVLSGTTQFGYEDTKFIMPCRIGRCISAGQIERYGDGLLMSISWRVKDVEAVTGFSAEMQYDGYTVLTKPAYLSGDYKQSIHSPDIAVLDAGTGPFEIISNSDFNIVSQPHGWLCQDKESAWWFRQFLHDVKGCQKAFLIPTFCRDMQLTRSVGSDETELYILNCRITRNMGLNALRTYLAFRPAADELIVRKITDISVINDYEEMITINTAPGQAFEPGEYLCWVDRCRIDSDDIEMNWYGRGKCKAETPLLRITN